MNELELLIDLHRDGQRQGPGGEQETRQAIDLSGLNSAGSNRTTRLKIADIGCGSGASTLVLANQLDATVTAIDFLPSFLTKLDMAATQAGLSHRIKSVAASMKALPFEPDSFDAIWSEGAIYNMGFLTGVKAWRHFLKPDGILAVSELTWLTGERPVELHQHWAAEYPEVDTAAAKMAILEQNGYAPVAYFTLPRHCWQDNYYRPLQTRFANFLARHQHSAAAQAVVDSEQQEIDLYERHSAFVSYGFYLARKSPSF